jgi:hypothetical protein
MDIAKLYTAKEACHCQRGKFLLHGLQIWGNQMNCQAHHTLQVQTISFSITANSNVGGQEDWRNKHD